VKTVAALIGITALVLVAFSSVAAARPIRVSTSISTRSPSFGDVVTARVTVLADRRQVDPASVHLAAPFGDWEEAAPTRTASISGRQISVMTWSFDIVCLRTSCLGNRHPATVSLPPVSVSVKRNDGSLDTVRRAWPTLSIIPRFGPAPAGGTPNFQVDQELPPATFRLGPGAFALALDAAAILLAALGLVIVARVVIRRRPARTSEVPPLAHALAVVRQAKTRPVDDRRRAAGLLARTLAHDRDNLAGAASQAAWSAGEPSPSRLEELATMVETGREDER
jgi:hypothetical protein